MRVVQHVFRRGAVYWWRRRLLKKTGERELAPIAISLRTRDLFKARSIAAHLAAASDGILRRQEGREVLSSAQVRSMLESVARTHLAKLDRLAVLETADGITADEGRRSDRVMGWARRLQASQGIAAAVGEAERALLVANGLSPDEIEEVHWTLELLRQGSMGSFPRQKLMALLEACGAPQGEGDLRQAERIFYRGQAAALLSVDRRWTGDYREDDKLVDQLLSDHGVAPGVIPLLLIIRYKVHTACLFQQRNEQRRNRLGTLAQRLWHSCMCRISPTSSARQQRRRCERQRRRPRTPTLRPA